ncbi:hypothetical protein Sjap_020399 [Stephania japonica]|uniref:Uncharacterized protein n=1 Tax=Stephania japonica TaxID=461633 RepID=A0AAP0F3B1_9MAGN
MEVMMLTIKQFSECGCQRRQLRDHSEDWNALELEFWHVRYNSFFFYAYSMGMIGMNAFITCWQIADNIILAHEILHSMSNGSRKMQEMALGVIDTQMYGFLGEVDRMDSNNSAWRSDKKNCSIKRPPTRRPPFFIFVCHLQ